jgi:hypothetical protein
MAIQISSNTVIDNSRKFIPVTIEAGGSTGSSGQLLASTGTGLEWTTPAGGFSVTNDTTTNATYYPVFVNTTSGQPSQTSVSSTKLQFNPSTGGLIVSVLTANAGTFGSNGTGTRTIQSGGTASGGSNGDIYYIF